MNRMTPEEYERKREERRLKDRLARRRQRARKIAPMAGFGHRITGGDPRNRLAILLAQDRKDREPAPITLPRVSILENFIPEDRA